MASPRPADPRAPTAVLSDALLESDAAYFEAGAQRRRLPGAVMAWMEGLAKLPAAGVVHRVEPRLSGTSSPEWLDTIEQAVRSIGRDSARIYLVHPHRELEAALQLRGYQSRIEVGFVHRGPLKTDRSGLPQVSLRPVITPDDWLAKVAVHTACDIAADGHPTPPEDWALMERRKIEAGFMRPFLVMAEGAACGVVSMADQGALCRLKNLVLHPGWRHRGIGTAVIRRLVSELCASGRTAGVFAVAGGAGERIYRHNGFTAVNQQTEWLGTVRP